MRINRLKRKVAHLGASSRLLLPLWIASLGVTQGSWATQSQEVAQPWTHYGARPLAMGNAFVAVADDYNALFYNPAGLARLQEWDGEFLNPRIEISKNTQDFLNDMGNLGSDSQSVLDLIESNTGKNHHFAAGMTPHLVFPGFGFGIGAQFNGSLTFHRYPSAFVDAGLRLTIPISYAMSFMEDRLSVGATLKTRVRGGVFHEFSIEDLQALQDDSGDSSSGPKIDDFMEAGMGYGTDLGILYTPMEPMKPTFGLSITDLGGTPYEKMALGSTDPKSAPSRVLPAVNLGLSFRPIENDGSYLLATMDMHAINQPYDFSKKLNFGLEYGIGSIIKLLSGLHQGYLTAGVQVDVNWIILRLASYAVELGETAGSVEDRRYMFELKLLF